MSRGGRQCVAGYEFDHQTLARIIPRRLTCHGSDPPIIESPRILREETRPRNTKNFKRDRRIRHRQAIFLTGWGLDSRTENRNTYQASLISPRNPAGAGCQRRR